MGKSIRIFLVDGSPSGIRTAEIVNWTGRILVVPRSRIGEVANSNDVKRTGVYILAGDDPDMPSRKRVYIGEADSVFDRLKGHISEDSKDFWTETVLITNKDLNLTKAHVRFLESRLIGMTEQAGRATLENGTKGTSLDSMTLPDSDVSDMTEFLDQVRLILPVIGFDFLQPSIASALANAVSGSDESPIFELIQGKYHAKAREIDGQFIVLKGSLARLKPQPSWTLFKSGREALQRDGKLVPSDDTDCLSFVEDIAFNSPSAAAAAVLARNDNGRRSWKVAGTKTSYQEWFENSLRGLVPESPPITQ